MAVVFANTNEMSHEEWLSARRNGIGGSDASAIAGLNKWKSPIAVYLEKTGQAPEESMNSEAAYWARCLRMSSLKNLASEQVSKFDVKTLSCSILNTRLC